MIIRKEMELSKWNIDKFKKTLGQNLMITKYENSKFVGFTVLKLIRTI